MILSLYLHSSIPCLISLTLSVLLNTPEYVAEPVLTQIPSNCKPIPLLSGSSIPETSEYTIVIVVTPSGKVSLAVPLLSAVDSVLSFAVRVFPLTEKVGEVLSESALGFPASDVTTTLSFHPLDLESISVMSILTPSAGFVNVIVVVTAD